MQAAWRTRGQCRRSGERRVPAGRAPCPRAAQVSNACLLHQLGVAARLVAVHCELQLALLPGGAAPVARAAAAGRDAPARFGMLRLLRLWDHQGGLCEDERARLEAQMCRDVTLAFRRLPPARRQWQHAFAQVRRAFHTTLAFRQSPCCVSSGLRKPGDERGPSPPPVSVSAPPRPTGDAGAAAGRGGRAGHSRGGARLGARAPGAGAALGVAHAPTAGASGARRQGQVAV